MSKILCDGCVNGLPHECHGSHSIIRGELTHKQCECETCNPEEFESEPDLMAPDKYEMAEQMHRIQHDLK